MGASTPVRVTVLKLVEAEITIYAVTTAEAEAEAARMPGVARVVGSRYQKPDED